jgi:RNA polymerase sigma factor (sigma-70 family)
MLERRTRPSRGEIDEAALALLARHGAQILATARRYAANPDDAEDAYQRGLEILLTKAPTTREDELVPWLKTVVKHEAFALRRQRERLTPVTGDGEPVERGTAPSATHEQAERYERLSQSAEALSRLKPQEIRCLVLRAQGLSYREICNATGFTYTKVNRCLTEGRQALSGRLAGIEGGVECARLAPLLSALADGEADAAALARLRPHLKTCLSCRARLREFRAAPQRVAAVVPVALTAGGDGMRRLVETAVGALQQKAEALLAGTHHKAAVLSERAQTAAELITSQKVAALAASAAALAGGGTAVDHLANHRGPPRHAATARQAQTPAPAQQQPAAPPPSSPPQLTPEQLATTEQAAPPPPPPTPPPPPDPANEFEAGAAPPTGEAASGPATGPPGARATPAPAADTPSTGAPASSTAAARPAPSQSHATGEFAP